MSQLLWTFTRTLSGATYVQEYDAEGRLITVTQGANTTIYTYDDDGNRVKQLVNGVTTLFVSAQFEVQLGSPDQATVYYLFGGKRIAMRSGDTVTFLHDDHLGGTAASTSGVVAGGSQTSKQKYYAYGGIRVTIGIVPTPYEFTGQRLDTSDNLYFYGARYYDSAIGVFIQPDSTVPESRNSQNYNRYSYVVNNPLRYTDPTGEKPWCPDGICEDPDDRGPVVIKIPVYWNKLPADQQKALLDAYLQYYQNPAYWVALYRENPSSRELQALKAYAEYSERTFLDQFLGVDSWAANSSQLNQYQEQQQNGELSPQKYLGLAAGPIITLGMIDASANSSTSHLPTWVNNDGSLLNYLKNSEGTTLSLPEVDEAFNRARQYGLTVETVHAPHLPPNPHDYYHVNVLGKNINAHVAVPSDYVLPWER